MKKFWMNSIPALTVLFVFAFGFMAFHILIQNAEADLCDDLTEQCAAEAANVTVTCNSSRYNAQECEWARRDYDSVCSAASNACN